MPTPPIQPTGPKWRRQPEERPRQILDAALEVFGEQGLAGARLDDIARRAGVAKGTIYLYFPNKEALFREVIRQTVIERLAEAELRFESPAGTATDELRCYLLAWWAFLCTPAFQTVYKLVHAELDRFPDLAHFYAQEVVLRNRRLIGTLVQRGIERGEFRVIEPAVAARMITALFTAHVAWAARPAVFQLVSPHSPDEVFEQLSEFVVHALRPIPVPPADIPARSPGTFRTI